jgi:hypothetical protein
MLQEGLPERTFQHPAAVAALDRWGCSRVASLG